MTPATIIISFLFGLIVGSFLNVVIFRLKSNRQFVKGRSACQSCGHELSALDLIPVASFLFLRGRCRYCRAKLSPQYPIVELVTGVVFGLIGFRFGLGLPGLSAAVLSGFFIVVAVYDFKHLLILDKVVLPGAVVALLFNVATDLSGSCASWWQCRTISGLIGAAIIAGFFLLQHLISKGRWIGFGDVKYGLMLGLSAGMGGSLVLLFVAYLAGAFAGLSLIAFGRKQLSSRLPFGTFLSLSAIITLLWGGPILSWYLALIGF
ncbi:MAG: prepilin peptidase [Candidatus Saccharibacteria bacterium]